MNFRLELFFLLALRRWQCSLVTPTEKEDTNGNVAETAQSRMICEKHRGLEASPVGY